MISIAPTSSSASTSSSSASVNQHPRLALRQKNSQLTIPLATGLLELQIPQQVARYASFMFSFLGRGLCKYPLSLSHYAYTSTNPI
jgi:hypothetical protein